jgi:hypothetical protein
VSHKDIIKEGGRTSRCKDSDSGVEEGDVTVVGGGEPGWGERIAWGNGEERGGRRNDREGGDVTHQRVR